MKHSIYQQKKIDRLKREAVRLYKTGLSLRDVGDMVGKSHEWVRAALLSPVPIDKN